MTKALIQSLKVNNRLAAYIQRDQAKEGRRRRRRAKGSKIEGAKLSK
jgi:hypothetical protein